MPLWARPEKKKSARSGQAERPTELVGMDWRGIPAKREAAKPLSAAEPPTDGLMGRGVAGRGISSLLGWVAEGRPRAGRAGARKGAPSP